MKKDAFIFLVILNLIMFSCIGEDVIDDEIEERLSIDNPIGEIEIGDTYQFTTTFFNNVGQPETTTANWLSTNSQFATITSDGLLTAISEGTTTIRATVNLSNDNVVSVEQTIMVTSEPVEDTLITKSGTIVTTSSYLLMGNFTISELENSQNLELSIQENYQASTSLPGLYLYLTNNPNSINDALEIGPVQIFNGAHTYEIENININQYSYLLYWCEPFSVKVGEGEIVD